MSRCFLARWRRNLGSFTPSLTLMLAIYIYISLLYYVPTRWGQLVLEGGNARLLILRAWTTVPRPLLLGYTFQSLTRYKGDRFRSWLRPSVPISKGLYTHRGNRPHISADETGLAWSEGWFGRVDSDPDPSEFSAVGRQTERVGSGTVSCEVWN